MATPNSNKSYRVTGRLAFGCTDLALAWPHGGTGFGIAGQVYFLPPSRYATSEREEDGSVGRVTFTGGRTVLGVDFLEWNDTIAEKCFPSSVAGANARLVEFPGSGVQPGSDISPIGNLVFTPYNQDEHPAICLYNAFPVLETNQRLLLSSYRVLAPRVLFLGKEDSNGRVYAMGALADIPGVS